MPEPKSSATLRALAELADLSANQLQEGRSVEEVIEILRKAAAAVRSAVSDGQAETEAVPNEIANDLEPVDFIGALQEPEKSSA